MMKYARMEQIINDEIPCKGLVKNEGIVIFYSENYPNGEISVGISFEDDEDEKEKDRYIFNLFWNSNEYINIGSTGVTEETINELVETWNSLL